MSPVTGITVDYKRPAHFDDMIDISVTIGKYTGVKLEIAYEMYNRTGDELCAEAVSSHCFIMGSKIISLKREVPELDALIKDHM